MHLAISVGPAGLPWVDHLALGIFLAGLGLIGTLLFLFYYKNVVN